MFAALLWDALMAVNHLRLSTCISACRNESFWFSEENFKQKIWSQNQWKFFKIKKINFPLILRPNRKSKISLSSMRVGGSYSQESKYSWVLSNDQIWVPNSFSASRSSICYFLPTAEASLRKWLRSLKEARLRILRLVKKWNFRKNKDAPKVI